MMCCAVRAQQARTPEEVHAGFMNHIEDLVVLPHVHLHRLKDERARESE